MKAAGDRPGQLWRGRAALQHAAAHQGRGNRGDREEFSRYTAVARHSRGAQGHCGAPRRRLRFQLRDGGVRLYHWRQAGPVQRISGAGWTNGDEVVLASAVLGSRSRTSIEYAGGKGGVCGRATSARLPHYGEDDRGGDYAEDQAIILNYAVEPVGRGGCLRRTWSDRAPGPCARHLSAAGRVLRLPDYHWRSGERRDVHGLQGACGHSQDRSPRPTR